MSYRTFGSILHGFLCGTTLICAVCVVGHALQRHWDLALLFAVVGAFNAANADSVYRKLKGG